MYSSDRMKTLISFLKDYDNIVFMDCQMHFLNIYLRRKEILLILFRHCVELPVKNQQLLDYFWDISRDWERLQGTTTLHGRLVSIVYCFIHTVYVQRYCSQPLKMQIFERLLHVLFNSCVFGQCSYTIPGHESLRYQINPSLWHVVKVLIVADARLEL